MTEIQANPTHVNDPVDRIFHYALLTQASADVCVHAYVIFLILTVAKETLNTFRYCLLFCAVCEVCFVTWIGFVWQPRSFMSHYNCTSTEGFLAMFGFNGAVIGHIGMFVIAGTTVGSHLYAILYRLVIVTVNGGAEKFVTFPVTSACAMFILALTCTLSLVQYSTLGSQAYVSTLLLEMRTTGDLSENDVAVACTDLSRFTVTWAAKMAALTVFSEGTCIGLCTATFCRLRRTTIFSDRTKRMHTELTRLMLMQSIVPFIVFVIPSLASCLTIPFGIPLNQMVVCVSMFSVLTFPFFNALLTLYFVRPYRAFTLNLCRRVLRKKNAVVIPT